MRSRGVGFKSGRYVWLGRRAALECFGQVVFSAIRRHSRPAASRLAKIVAAILEWPVVEKILIHLGFIWDLVMGDRCAPGHAEGAGAPENRARRPRSWLSAGQAAA